MTLRHFQRRQLLLPSICIVLLTVSAHAQPATPSQDTLPQLIAQTKLGLVYINVGTNIDTLASQGTGFLIDAKGTIVTCAHVLFDTNRVGSFLVVPDTSVIHVRFPSRTNFFRARLAVYRRDRDVAILRPVPGQRGLDSVSIWPLVLAKSSVVEEGLDVVTTGYDLSGQRTRMFNRVVFRETSHRGIVSSVLAVGPEGGPEFIDSFQADVIVNPGASGSPVYRASDGNVVGMVKSFQGVEVGPLRVNFGLAECVPSWVIMKLYLSLEQSAGGGR